MAWDPVDLDSVSELPKSRLAACDGTDQCPVRAIEDFGARSTDSLLAIGKDTYIAHKGVRTYNTNGMVKGSQDGKELKLIAVARLLHTETEFLSLCWVAV